MTLKKKLTHDKLAEMINPPNNMTFNEIGKIYGVSRQRVHQVYKFYRKEKPYLFIEKEEIAKEDIKSLLNENMSRQHIAKRLGISTKKLNKLMDQYGLEKKYLKDTLNKSTLGELFIGQRKSDTEIAKLWNCSAYTVASLRREHNIKDSLRKSHEELIPKELFIELYIDKGLLLSQISEVFNINKLNVAKLKEKYEIDEYFKGKGGKYRARGVGKENLFEIKNDLRKRGKLV